ncbi:MAG: hypothetical protein IPM06_17815 [Rhizobiales bacterium]|nr:hypothetical protein [Hyphomicrobiales bacterium]
MAANLRTLQKSFTGGEVSPEFWARADDAKYQAGLAIARNFIVKPQGPIENRAGFQFVHSTKDSAKLARLIPFIYSTDQSIAIEFGDQYLRFHTDGATLLTPSASAWSNASNTVTISVSTSAVVTITTANPGVVTWNAHGMANGDPVAFTTTGKLPGLTAGLTYYVRDVTANTFKIAATVGGTALSTFVSSSGTQTAHKLTAGVVTWAAHGLANGTPLLLTTTGALPSRLTANGVYYVINAATNTFGLAESVGGAGVHTFGSQSGTHTAARWYLVGDLVASGGSTYYCILGHTNQVPPNATYWYLEPASGEYEIPTPYADEDVANIHYVQSADVLTLVHPGYAPRELRRYSATNWQMSAIAFASAQTPPGTATATATGGTGTDYAYVVTSVDSKGFDESIASTIGYCDGNLFAAGAYNTVTWNAMAGVTRYRVYRKSGGLFGYVGQADDATSFTDDNIAPDLSRTPPIAQTLFESTGNYPAAVSYFEQRRVFAGTTDESQNIWMTKSGTESNMDYSLPIKDDDSIQFRIAAREASTIRHVVPLSDLVFLSSSTEFSSVSSDALTPETINVKPQSYIGANNVQPVIVSNNVIYGAARGGHAREMAYAWQNKGYISGDLSLRAPHLFDDLQVVDMAYQKAPYPVVWLVSSNGSLLSFTYVPEQQVGAWARHDTDGAFEACCVVPEGDQDVLYVVVRRTINGQTKRYIERLHQRSTADQADSFFVDCGLTYDGAPATTISGLGHLEGKTVSILGDGAVMAQEVVTAGAITLPQAVSVAHIGLPYIADIQTLPLWIETEALGQTREKNVNKVQLRVYRSSGIFVGQDFDHLTEYKQRNNEPYGSPPALKTAPIDIVIKGQWTPDAQVCIRQIDPLPLTISGIALEVTVA